MSTGIDPSVLVHMRLTEQLIEALGLDPDDADGCVPGCLDGPAGTEHMLWHLVQQRDDAQAELARVTSPVTGDELRDELAREQM